MESKRDRRRAVREYKEAKALGGVYAVVNRITGETVMTEISSNITGQENRFAFGMRHGGSFPAPLEAQYKKYGKDAFSFVILETLEQEQNQSAESFLEDLEALKEICVSSKNDL